MKHPAIHLAAAACAGLLSFTAVAQQHDGPADPPQGAKLTLENCQRCGTVTSVFQEKRKGEGGAAGVVGGAVIGGLLGNQIGGGSGRTLATVGGAVAGGYAGNEVQKHATSKMVWVTEVRLRDGTVRKFEQEARPRWREGNILRVRGNSLSY